MFNCGNRTSPRETGASVSARDEVEQRRDTAVSATGAFKKRNDAFGGERDATVWPTSASVSGRDAPVCWGRQSI
jgi:hypothetical protein